MDKKRNMDKKWWLVLPMALMLVAFPILSGCASTPAATPAPSTTPTTTPSATPAFKEIVIGDITDLTGAVAGSGVDASEGQTDVVRYINEKGGVKGIPVRLVTVDSSYQLDKVVNLYHRLVDTEKPLAMTHVLSPAATMVRPLAKEDQVIQLFVPEPTALWPAGDDNWCYGTHIQYPDTQKVMLQWWGDNMWKGPGAPRIGLCVLDNAAGWAGAAGIQKVCDKNGWPIVVKTWVAGNASEVTSQVLALKNANCDVVCSLLADAHYCMFYPEAVKQGLKGQVIAHWCCLSHNTMVGCGTGLNGTIDFWSHPTWDEDVPIMKTIKGIRAQYYPAKADIPVSSLYMMGWCRIATFCEAFRIAYDKVGPANMTRKDIKDAFYDIKDFTAEDATCPLTYTRQDHRGGHATRVVQIMMPECKVKALSGYINAPELTPEEMTVEWYTKARK